jgi:lambda repressor-like predicted transcriptional regulator
VSTQLAQAIRVRASIAGVSLNEVERRAGWKRGTLYGVLKTAMSITSLEKIAKAIGIPSWMLLRDVETNAAIARAAGQEDAS